MNIKNTIYLIKRSIKFFWQRTIRGWDDSETWSLDAALSKLIVPRLKRFKEVNICYPPNMTPQEWDEKLDLMIEAFEFYSGEQYCASGEELKKHQKGLNLFAKHFGKLWW